MTEQLSPERASIAGKCEGVGADHLPIKADFSFRFSSSVDDGLVVYRFLVGPLGIKPVRLSEHLGLSRGAISEVGSGRRGLSFDNRYTLLLLLEALREQIRRQREVTQLRAEPYDISDETFGNIRLFVGPDAMASIQKEQAHMRDTANAYDFIFDGLIKAADALIEIEYRSLTDLKKWAEPNATC